MRLGTGVCTGVCTGGASEDAITASYEPTHDIFTQNSTYNSLAVRRELQGKNFSHSKWSSNINELYSAIAQEENVRENEL
jgi:hypothetical protein